MWDMARARAHECLLPMVFIVAEGAGIGVVIKRSLSRPLVLARSVGEIAITNVVLPASKRTMEGWEGPGARGTGAERERANNKRVRPGLICNRRRVRRVRWNGNQCNNLRSR